MAVALGALSFKKSDRLTAFFLKLLCLAPLLSAAFIHSSFYTNDYGWRTTTASELILYIFTAVLLERSWENISARVKLPARAAAVFVLGTLMSSNYRYAKSPIYSVSLFISVALLTVVLPAVLLLTQKNTEKFRSKEGVKN